MDRDHIYYAYIMSNRSQNFYVGVTSELRIRVIKHKNGTYEGFTSRYKLDRLVYYETFSQVQSAIRREKQLKGWSRKKKIDLIVSMNPTWRDLSEDWGKPIEPLLKQTERILAEAERKSKEIHRPFDSRLAFGAPSTQGDSSVASATCGGVAEEYIDPSTPPRRTRLRSG